MVDITPLLRQDMLLVNSYRHPNIKLNDRPHQLPLLVYGNQSFSWDKECDLMQIPALLQQYHPSLCDDCHLIIIGCGARMVKITKEIKNAWATLSRDYDIMATQAAIGCFNIAVVEGRKTIGLFY